MTQRSRHRGHRCVGLPVLSGFDPLGDLGEDRGEDVDDAGGVLPGVSQKMLTQHLKELQRHGVVHRESYHEVPPRVEYSMTPAGEALLKALAPLSDWAEEHIELICAARPDAG
ncbi:winged helix-turn-helix transcriptional regulator [Mycolicibacterium frederiksbergense]|uniref:winged helix-turn-helix transcriptional regulator n=1 Tax=Mycolicibacterium frederiksbergense TaxID=117567 RepID=UPI00265C1181|nr:helix-turn-helix domain-containing protein [Mycolicibacterium frederiksbergense]MDO0974236.1 helix-turn-helix domain-containing protein [Mycolicibacterium frederiksbergense]